MNKKLFVLMAITILISGCSIANSKNEEGPAGITLKTEKMTKKEKTVNEKTPKNVVLKTNRGDITIKILPNSAPKTVESFWKLSRDGKYDNVPFHRVIKDFMIQTGDYENKNGTGGKSWFGQPMKNEIDTKLTHKRGMVSMANAGPDTNGSQFFIVHKDSAFLDGNYSIFGEVIKGMDVVDAIAETKTMPGDRPVEEIVINNTDLEF
jgi:cyclophilin family peptidyl-prolyl cis-trans isomerase